MILLKSDILLGSDAFSLKTIDLFDLHQLMIWLWLTHVLPYSDVCFICLSNVSPVELDEQYLALGRGEGLC